MRDSEIQKPAGTDSAPVTFIVREGETPDLIGGKLQAAGLIGDAGLFAQVVKYKGVGPNLQAGRIPVAPDDEPGRDHRRLAARQQNEVRVTIGEGWRLEQSRSVFCHRTVYRPTTT